MAPVPQGRDTQLSREMSRLAVREDFTFRFYARLGKGLCFWFLIVSDMEHSVEFVFL